MSIVVLIVKVSYFNPIRLPSVKFVICDNKIIDMLTIDPNSIEISKLHGYLLGAVGPRPIAFASTISEEGIPNLAPFSFFNVFSANPPILIFSPARSVRGNRTKNTLDNALETKEVVINVVNYEILQQMSLSSTAYAPDVDEFEKSGLTKVKSELVQPFRVKESPVQFECRVNEVQSLGPDGGAGNLIICQVLKIHIKEEVLNESGIIDQKKIDLVSRMGGNWYCHANEASMFELIKPITKMGIGIDAIPADIRNSKILSGNDLGQLGNEEALPSQDEIDAFKELTEVKSALESEDAEKALHMLAKEYLAKDINTAQDAWKVLLANK